MPAAGMAPWGSLPRRWVPALAGALLLLCGPAAVASEPESEPDREPRRKGTLEVTPEPGSEAIAPESGPAPVPWQILSVDRYLSIETGADITTTLAGWAGQGETRLLRPLDGSGGLAVTTRAVWTLAIDVPLSFWLAILQHEAFGHGGRVREFGHSSSLRMGPLWSFERTSSAGFDAADFTNDQLLTIYAGGSEANGWTATITERRMVAGRPMAGFDLLYLAWNRYATSAYILRTTPDPRDDPAGFYGEWAGGGDVAHYLGHQNIRFFGTPGITPTGSSPSVLAQWDRMERGAYWNLLDPGLWLALWGTGRQVIRGGAPAPIPLPKMAGRRFLPILSSDWLPDAVVLSLEIAVERNAGQGPSARYGPGWGTVLARHGTGPGGSYWAAGAGTDSQWHTGRWRIGGDFEVWSRIGGGLGGGIRTRFLKVGGRAEGMLLEGGVKSAGHWPGRPAGTGPFFRFGWVFRDQPAAASGSTPR
jgi:hypothetical protein